MVLKMGRPVAPTALQELQTPSSIPAQIGALKTLKNEIIGHDQRKELVIRHGIVEPLVRILSTYSRTSGKKRMRERSDNGDNAEKSWTEEDDLRLQATLIVASLGNGGLPFVVPLIAGGLFQPLLTSLSPKDNDPRLVLATLRALLVLAEPYSHDLDAVNRQISPSLPAQLYTRPVVNVLVELLVQPGTSAVILEHIISVAQLLGATCQTAQHRQLLVKSGVLDLLAARLASTIVSMNYPIPDADPAAVKSLLPSVPPSKVQFLLNAIAAITDTSPYRTARLLYSPPIYSVFPITKSSKPPPNESTFNVSGGPVQKPESIDMLLPQIQAEQSKREYTYSKAFPALSSLTSGLRQAGQDFDFGLTALRDPSGQPQPSSRPISGSEFGSPLIAWLIHTSRTTTGLERLSAINLLTLMVRAIDNNSSSLDIWVEPSRNRDRTLAFLVVPLIVKMLDESLPSKKSSSKSKTEESLPVARKIKESAPIALARLIEDSPALQSAAVDAGATPKLCTFVKKSFDSITTTNTQMWSPHQVEKDNVLSGSPATTLGEPGMVSQTLHALRYRAAAMTALSAIVQREDMYRRELIKSEGGMAPCIVESLVPRLDAIPAYEDQDRKNAGNPTFVIVAACDLIRALSRSVHVLRTNLIDAGVAVPVLRLLKHKSLDVQLAATNACCNLLLHFSPMRSEVQNTDALKTLCMHAHSADAELQFTSLWALKHLMHSAPVDLKTSCLEELGSGWLVQTISADVRFGPNTPSLSMGTPNAAGEQVDLLNAAPEPLMDVDSVSSEDDEEDDDAMTDSIGALNLPKYNVRATSAQNRVRLRAIKEAEFSPAIKEQRDRIRIQEQALDFIRNIIGEPGQHMGVVIDHLLDALGTDRLFEILASKLRANPTAFSSTSPAYTHIATPSFEFGYKSTNNPKPSAPASTAQMPPTSVMVAAIFILIHMANGSAKHRHLLLHFTSPSLPPLITPLFNHPDRRVRVACCWLAFNLIWQDDNSDADGARLRALELRRLGWEEKVKGLLNDGDLDCRERAKNVVEQLSRLEVAAPLGMGGRSAATRVWES
ncbi:ARM repeat-containing protein [Eremomyces bilateralis CBS 781.70]|uniref:ARM repeat-containing protein n=1 Tax=Eremomyces bilateralis CBS 781.70 TaxID=1392243 RepID=A0A6G1FZP4_9PEZI|nr:ARM repeat-containing protein [Eremomyces bilateralis CBS 781.70]KAF1811151.1 ARM repeat-containing protein [Eremomyces bilateralis CBS 781.70]